MIANKYEEFSFKACTVPYGLNLHFHWFNGKILISQELRYTLY